MNALSVVVMLTAASDGIARLEVAEI